LEIKTSSYAEGWKDKMINKGLTKLDNPSWLKPLEQQGHFADLPQPEPISDGRIA